MMLYKQFLGMHFKQAYQYKVSSLLVTISSMLVSVGEIIGIWLLFQNFNTIGEWGFYESALMFGIITSVFTFSECFFRGYDEFPNLIKTGTLDRLLVRPVNIYLQILYQKIEWTKLGRASLGLVISIFAICNLTVQWTFLKFVVLILMYVCGIAVILGLILISAGVIVFTVENLEFLHILTSGSKEVAFYPINIYKKWLRNIFTFIIPLACFNYLPLSYILGVGSVPMWLCAISPILGMLFVVPCFLFFRFALSKYQGTGT